MEVTVSDSKVVYQVASNSHSGSKISQLDNGSHIDSDILLQLLSQRIMSAIHL